jgi:hypothetical protein
MARFAFCTTFLTLLAHMAALGQDWVKKYHENSSEEVLSRYKIDWLGVSAKQLRKVEVNNVVMIG